MNPISTLLRYLQSNAIPFVVDGIPSVPPSVEPHALSSLAEVRRVTVTPVQVDQQVWLAVAEESSPLRLELIGRAFGGKPVTTVHHEDLSLLFPGCALEAIPPLGHLFGVPVMCAESLMSAPAWSFAAFTPETSITMRTSDLRSLAKPLAAEIAGSTQVSTSLA